MKSLALYIDKWYIVGAVCVDDVPRPVCLPNHEDRIWLYFHEDTANDEISYGRGYQQQYRNHQNHYYGDVFTLLTDSTARYTMFKRLQEMKGIFKSAKIFDDLRRDMEEEGDIETYVSFSKDISPAAQLLFLKEMEAEHFVVKEKVARIGHLALENASRRNGYDEEGYYLVLNACNENLHYSLYQLTAGLFLRKGEAVLLGNGMDVRSRALIEYVVDNINNREHFLKNPAEREAEYLRMAQYVGDWLAKLQALRTQLPIQLTGVTFANDPYKDYTVQVRKARIDERTERIVKDIISVVVRFVKEQGVSHEQIKGILLLGNTFTNVQFKKELGNYYNLPPKRMVCCCDTDLSTIVSTYQVIDCAQFSADSRMMTGNAVAELQRIEQARQEAEAMKKAQAAADALDKNRHDEAERERKFNEAMDKGYDAEQEHDYVEMAEYFNIALGLQTDNAEAKNKYEEALRLKARDEVRLNTYKEKIQQAKNALMDGDYENAKQYAVEALNAMPDSQEARRIKEEALRYINNSKTFDRYIDRADVFIAQKIYDEAIKELDKAKLLGLDDKEIRQRENRIAQEQEALRKQISNLTGQMETALAGQRYEDAAEVCNRLIDIDLVNSRKWSAHIADIRHRAEKAKEDERHLDALQKEIDEAHWKEDWPRLVNLCKEALSICDDEALRTKLERGEKQMAKQQETQRLDATIVEIKDMILHAEFGKAKSRLALLSKEPLDAAHKESIKNLRKLLFEKEEEAELAKRAKSGRTDDFFQSEKPALRENQPTNERAVVKGFSAPSAPKPAKPKPADDFFASNDKRTAPKKKWTRDDFNF